MWYLQKNPVKKFFGNKIPCEQSRLARIPVNYDRRMSKFGSIHQNISGSISALGQSIQNLTSAVTSKDNNESRVEKYGYLTRRGMFKQWVCCLFVDLFDYLLNFSAR